MSRSSTGGHDFSNLLAITTNVRDTAETFMNVHDVKMRVQSSDLSPEDAGFLQRSFAGLCICDGWVRTIADSRDADAAQV